MPLVDASSVRTRHSAISKTARAFARRRASLESLPAGLRGLPRVDVPLLPFGLVGIDALRKMGTLNPDDRDPSPSLVTSAFRGEWS
jgi:hypothetical protein